MVEISVLGVIDAKFDWSPPDVTAGVGVDFKGFDKSWSETLSYNHPSASVNTGSHAGFSASATVSIDDASGDVSLSGKYCYPYIKPWHKPTTKCKSGSTSANLLKPFEFGLAFEGVTPAGYAYLAGESLIGSITAGTVQTVRENLSSSLVSAIEDNKAWGTALGNYIKAHDGWSHSDVTQLSVITEAQWQAAISAVGAKFKEQGIPLDIFTTTFGSSGATSELSATDSDNWAKALETAKMVLELTGIWVAFSAPVLLVTCGVIVAAVALGGPPGSR
jgi:hypothetical protein